MSKSQPQENVDLDSLAHILTQFVAVVAAKVVEEAGMGGRALQQQQPTSHGVSAVVT